MTDLLKIAGVTAGKKASGIKVDELGRIELSRTVEPKRIIGNVLEPYAADYKGPVSVFGLELYAINSEKTVGGLSYIQPTPDGWLMYTYGALYRYDSKGAVIWEAEGRSGGGAKVRDGLAAIHGGYVYAVTLNAGKYVLDKISYKTGKVITEGAILEGAKITTDLVYVADIDRLVGVTHSENSKNMKRVENNTGIQGIYYDRNTDKYVSHIRMDGKKVFQKTYDESQLEEAIKEREAKLLELGFHENHGK